ncbi:glycosyltransferase family 2 protein [Candidatus Roizmanbacteria bacterium]|nr:glycosyltransferase family 2 protein [Candidatus Roizmanbacteria bacterium]
MDPKITIVIGTLNRPKVVLSLIQRLEKAAKKIPLEVIVFNQGLKSVFPEKNNFILVHLEKPNTCKYLNLGWKKAKAPIVLYLDDDVTITEKTITSHIKAYDNPSIQAVAGRVINDGEVIAADPRVGKILWFGAVFTKNFSYEKQAFVDFPYGCNMSFRKISLEKVGGFDERLAPPIYSFNEIDIGYRISKRWHNAIVFKPEALVYHHRYKSGGTRNNFTQEEIFHGNQFNYGYFLGKNFSWIENIVCFFRKLPYQIIKEPKAIPDILQGFISGKKIRKK